MRDRRHAREVAFKLLYELEMNRDVPDEAREEDLSRSVRNEEARQFARQLIDGVRCRQRELDELIERCAEKWSLTRMGTTERVLLRMGAFEVLYQQQPAPVVISEITRLARRYGSEKSASFVQGVLNTILRHTGRAEECTPAVVETSGAGTASNGPMNGGISADS